MITLNQERLIPLSDVPKHLPLRPSGKCIHRSSVYRWVSKGIRGTTLESVRIGGTVYTSSEALQRFANCLTVTERTLAIEYGQNSKPKLELGLDTGAPDAR